MTAHAQAIAELDVVVITGLAGAGRSEAARVFEDLGWFVIDNLPPVLIDRMLALAATGEVRRIALVIDARGGRFFNEAVEALERFRADVRECRVVFLEASEDALVRRFEHERRRHPLAKEGRLIEGIRRERQIMTPLRDEADVIIDTSDLSVLDLRERLTAHFEGARQPELSTTVMSFGYKFGLPVDADIVLDCRFLPNPHWIEQLRPLTGLDEPVKRYVLDQEPTKRFLDQLDEMLDVLLVGYKDEGRHYLNIAVGCTGGRHRSAVLADEIGRLIDDRGYPVRVLHRDVERGTTAS